MFAFVNIVFANVNNMFALQTQKTDLPYFVEKYSFFIFLKCQEMFTFVNMMFTNVNRGF